MDVRTFVKLRKAIFVVLSEDLVLPSVETACFWVLRFAMMEMPALGMAATILVT